MANAVIPTSPIILINSTDSTVNTADYSYVLLPDSALSDELSQTLDDNFEDVLSSYLPVDTFLNCYLAKGPLQRTSLERTIPRYEGQALASTIQQQVWFTPLMLIMSVLYMWTLLSHSRIFSEGIDSFFFPKEQKGLYMSSEMDIDRMRPMLTVLSVLSISLFSYFALVDILSVVPQRTYITMIGRIVMIIVGVGLFKLLMIRLLCYVFYDADTWMKVIDNYSLLFNTLSIGLFGMVVMIAYSTGSIPIVALWIGLGMCIIGVILYVYKVLSVFFTGIASLFYLILYLCTLEILPSLGLIIGLMNIV